MVRLLAFKYLYEMQEKYLQGLLFSAYEIIDRRNEDDHIIRNENGTCYYKIKSLKYYVTHNTSYKLLSSSNKHKGMKFHS
jgi:hypothetical protein